MECSAVSSAAAGCWTTASAWTARASRLRCAALPSVAPHSSTSRRRARALRGVGSSSPRRIGLPIWLRKLVRGLLLGSNAVIAFGASTASAAVVVAWGVKQGCPTSGSFWALAFDPLVRAASFSAVRAGGSLGAFADDPSAAFRDLVGGLRSLVPVLLQMRRAAGLSLNIDKTSVVNFVSIPDERLQNELRRVLGIPTLCVCPEATSLGFVVTAHVSEKLWDSAVRRFLERVAYVWQVPGHTGDRIVAYTTLAFSTLRYRAQVHEPSTAALRAEASALASMFAALMYGLHPDLLAGLRLLGSRRRVPSLALAAQASRYRVAVAHPAVADHIAALDRARWGDDALLGWRAPGWVRHSPLRHAASASVGQLAPRRHPNQGIL